MKLLFSSSVTVLAVVSSLAVIGFAPLLAVLDVGTGRRSVLEFAGTSALVLAIVILGTGVSLPTETRRPLARLRFVVC